MPMSPRLLRPIARSGDSDVRAYIAAVEQADTQPLEQAVKDAYRDFIVGCKADGIWDAIKASCILMGARTLSGALTPLKGGAPTNVNNNFVSGDYDRKTGLVGNGSSKYINTNRANNADPQDSNHNAVYVSVLQTANGTFIASTASNATANGGNFIGGSTVSDIFTRNRSSTGTAGAAASTGFVGTSRIASGSYTLRSGSTNATVSVASQTPVTENVAVFTRLGGAPTYSNGRYAFYSVGESLDLALLDTRVTALYNAIGAAI
jgi:hypothetical protein